MSLILKSICFVCLIFIFTSCSKNQLITLSPKHRIAENYINIYSPNSNNWVKIKHSKKDIVFAKKGIENYESYIARIVFFPQTYSSNKKDFLEQIKKVNSKINNKKRFDILKSNFKFLNRSYECVLARSLMKDKKAKVPYGTDSLLMQVKSLYCKDPKNKKMAFMIGYSFRGKLVTPNFDSEADSFIDSIRFPQYN